MTYTDLVGEIKRLSLDERLALLDVVTRSIREEISRPEPRGRSLDRVRGMLKPDAPWNDDEFSDSYTRYLVEKYT